jgi:hypothetical protein
MYMGIFDGSHTKSHQVTILLTGFQVQGTLIVFGMLQTFINDEQKDTFTVKDAVVHGLEEGNPAGSMQLPELFIPKTQCHALAFEATLSHEETGLLPRTESLAVYTSHYVMQGKYHMGSDALLSDFITVSKSSFIGVSNAYFFPLFRAQTSMIKQAPLVFIHRNTVRMHHRA